MASQVSTTALLEKAEQLEGTAQMLRAWAHELDSGSSIERDAVQALTPAGKELVSYLLTEGGAQRYNKVLKDRGMTPASLGGVLGGAKRRQLPGCDPVMDYEDIPGVSDDWMVTVGERFRDAAWELELA